MNPKVSILLPAYKSKDLLKKVFIPSLENISLDVQVILYDNGGNELEHRLKERCYFKNKNGAIIDWITIGNGENVGLNRAFNRCAKVARGDYFFLPHTDMYMMSNCLDSLITEAKKHAPHTFLFCSRSIEKRSHIPSQILKDYGDIDNFDRQKLEEDFKDYKDSSVVVNARMPFFLSRKLWDRIGGVDEKLYSYCTDDDLIQQCYDVGVRKFWMVYDSLVYHLSGKSNSQQTVDKDKNWPYEYFISKWKSKYPNIHHPGQYHPKLIPFETKVK